jgi:hypothetical protein
LRWVNYKLGDGKGVESLLDLWPASNMSSILKFKTSSAPLDFVDESVKARELVAWMECQVGGLALNQADFVASLTRKPTSLGPVEMEWLWHVIEARELRKAGLAVGYGNHEETAKDLRVKLEQLEIRCKRFRPSNLLNIMIEMVKRLSNWEPDDHDTKQVVLTVANMILPVQLLDVEDLCGKVYHMRPFILYLTLFLEPLSSPKRLEVSRSAIKEDTAGRGGREGQGNEPESTPMKSASSSASSAPITAKTVTLLKDQLAAKEAEMKQLQALHLKELNQVRSAHLLQTRHYGEEVGLSEALERAERHGEGLSAELESLSALRVRELERMREMETQIQIFMAESDAKEKEWFRTKAALERIAEEVYMQSKANEAEAEKTISTLQQHQSLRELQFSEQLDILEQEMNATQLKHLEKVAGLQNELHALQVEERALKKREEMLQDEISCGKAEYASLRNEKEALTGKIELLENERVLERKEFDCTKEEFELDVMEKTIEIGRLKDELDDALKTSADLQSDREGLQGELAAAATQHELELKNLEERKSGEKKELWAKLKAAHKMEVEELQQKHWAEGNQCQQVFDAFVSETKNTISSLQAELDKSQRQSQLVGKLEKKLKTTEYLSEENSKLNAEQCAILCDEMLIVNEEWEQKLADANRQHEKQVASAQLEVEQERKDKEFVKIQLRKTISVLDKSKKQEHALKMQLTTRAVKSSPNVKFIVLKWMLVVCIFLRIFVAPIITI